jgi:hypothetical protein
MPLFIQLCSNVHDRRAQIDLAGIVHTTVVHFDKRGGWCFTQHSQCVYGCACPPLVLSQTVEKSSGPSATITFPSNIETNGKCIAFRNCALSALFQAPINSCTACLADSAGFSAVDCARLADRPDPNIRNTSMSSAFCFIFLLESNEIGRFLCNSERLTLPTWIGQ